MINTEANIVESNKFIHAQSEELVSIFHSGRDLIKNEEYKSSEKKGIMKDIKPENFENNIRSLEV